MIINSTNFRETTHAPIFYTVCYAPFLFNFMIKEEKQTQEITIKHKYCDDCGIEIKIDMACSVAKCEICGKDLCNKCIGYEANTMGDYREVYCKKCWEIGTEYRLKIEQLENEIENLSDEWHNRCLS